MFYIPRSEFVPILYLPILLILPTLLNLFILSVPLVLL